MEVIMPQILQVHLKAPLAEAHPKAFNRASKKLTPFAL